MHDLHGGVWWADGMPRDRRAVLTGGTFFFTVVTYRRWPLFADPRVRRMLGRVIRLICFVSSELDELLGGGASREAAGDVPPFSPNLHRPGDCRAVGNDALPAAAARGAVDSLARPSLVAEPEQSFRNGAPFRFAGGCG
jgi:hypothetical protein